MNKEDYSDYYIQGSDHYLIPKDVFDELFEEMESWKHDTQKHKEVIDKSIKYIYDEVKRENFHHYLDDKDMEELLDILKEVE